MRWNVMKFKQIFTIILALFFGAVLFFEGTAHAEKTTMKGVGCKTEFFMMKDLADAYKAKTGNKMQIGNTGNKKAVNLMLDQKVDFTFTCKPIEKLSKKLELDPKAVSSWKSIPVAKDPIVVVANPGVGVNGITSDQLTKLFKKEISNWKEIGGNDFPVALAHLAESLESGVVLLFKEFTVGSEGKFAKRAVTAKGPSMLGHFTSVTPGSITFMGLNSYKEKYGNILEIDGVAPTMENIFNGTYPLAATYYLTLDGSGNRDVADFIDFVLSKDGKQVIEQNFISISQ